MGTQITESEPRICSAWGSRTCLYQSIWYQMNHKPGKRTARRVRGPYLNYSTSTSPPLVTERGDQQFAKRRALLDG